MIVESGGKGQHFVIESILCIICSFVVQEVLTDPFCIS